MDPYEKLANAIVLQAVKDWRNAVRRLKRHPKNHEAMERKEASERFFQSGWFQVLTDVDGDMLLKKLKEEVKIP
jgi:hypothetical protein